MRDIMFEEQPEFYSPPDKRLRPDIPLVASRAAKRTGEDIQRDKYIADIVKQVSQENLAGWVKDLSAFHTRHTKSVYLHQAALWLEDRFKGFGYKDVEFHSYTKGEHDLENVVCTKPGSSTSARINVLCGHYDCRMENLDDYASRAPGADDNASGIAAILEIARILSGLDLKETVQFVTFSGEEQGMWGSVAYFRHLHDKGIDVHRLINLDQVGGYPRAGPSVIIERDLGNQISSNDKPSQEFAEIMAQMAADYSRNVTVQLGPIYASDYMPFEARGYVVIGVYEGEGNPDYHKSSDVPERVDYAYLTEITRMTLATVVKQCALAEV
jgi:acetylornithine deacetylase/succinyl-diaminopimelate desuccinylase-like protein